MRISELSEELSMSLPSKISSEKVAFSELSLREKSMLVSFSGSGIITDITVLFSISSKTSTASYEGIALIGKVNVTIRKKARSTDTAFLDILII